VWENNAQFFSVRQESGDLLRKAICVATMRLGKKTGTAILMKGCAPVAQMDQSGRFLNGKSRFDSGREHHSSVFAFVFNEFQRLKSDTAM
jgi:hypothetical protein